MRKLALAFLIVLIVGSVVAIDWPFDKESSCNAFNVTGSACDSFWCSSIHEGVWNDSMELCTLIIVVNQTTNTSNVTAPVNITLNTSEFYDKEQVDFLLNEMKINYTQRFVLQEDFDELKEETQEDTSSSSGLPTGTILIGLLVLAIVGMGWIATGGGKKQQASSEKGKAPIYQRKIQAPRGIVEPEPQVVDRPSTMEAGGYPSTAKPTSDQKKTQIDDLKKQIEDIENQLKEKE